MVDRDFMVPQEVYGSAFYWSSSCPEYTHDFLFQPQIWNVNSGLNVDLFRLNVFGQLEENSGAADGFEAVDVSLASLNLPAEILQLA